VAPTNVEIVGIATISNDENMNLPSGTAKSLVNPKQHLVEIEMFHQLHCIVSLHWYSFKLEISHLHYRKHSAHNYGSSRMVFV